MKKIIIALGFISWAGSLSAQIKKDTVKVDSVQLEKIHKMPMDTVKESMREMNPPSDSLKINYQQKDSALYRKSIDDVDPKDPK